MYNIISYAITHRNFLKSIFWIIFFHGIIVFTILNVGVTKYRLQHIFGFTYYTGYTVNDGTHKLKLWEAALGANKNFIVGTGMGIETSLRNQYQKVGLVKPLKENYNSHNQYIEYYVGLGMVGVLVFCYILFYFSKAFYLLKNTMGLQFIVITALLSITECLWNRHHGIVFFAIMLGLFWQLNPTVGNEKSK